MVGSQRPDKCPLPKEVSVNMGGRWEMALEGTRQRNRISIWLLGHQYPEAVETWMHKLHCKVLASSWGYFGQ